MCLLLFVRAAGQKYGWKNAQELKSRHLNAVSINNPDLGVPPLRDVYESWKRISKQWLHYLKTVTLLTTDVIGMFGSRAPAAVSRL